MMTLSLARLNFANFVMYFKIIRQKNSSLWSKKSTDAQGI